MDTIKASDILKKDNILRAGTDVTLKEALAKLTRSHDALFVFDDNDKFAGIISPYYVIFKSKFPPDTKLENCFFRPPKITPDTAIWDIAKLMVESKVYYLPVMTNSTFHGIVTLNRLLQAVVKNAKEYGPLHIASSGRLFTIQNNATLSDAYQLMRDKQISRLPVVNVTGNLLGIVTRLDIQEAYSKPQQKPRWLSRSGEKVAQGDQPLEKYYKKIAVTLPVETTGNKIIETLLAQNVGSVVLIDKNRKPVDIITSHDVLKAVSTGRPTENPNMSIDTPDDFIHHSQLDELMAKYLKKFTTRYRVKNISAHVEVQKNAAGGIKHYVFNLQAHDTNKHWVSKDENFDWKKAARGALDKLEHQLRKESN